MIVSTLARTFVDRIPTEDDRATDQSAEHARRSFLVSGLSVAFTAVLLASASAVFTGGPVDNRSDASLGTLDRSPALFPWNNDGDDPGIPIDDDGTRTGVCKEYVRNFLNGTTDARDQCQGMYNAYKEADCQHAKHGVGTYGYYKNRDVYSDAYNDAFDHQHTDDNGTVVDDDVVIDDDMQNWECCDSIAEFYENNCQEEEGLHSVRLLGITLVLLVCTIVKAMTKKCGVHWLPDACAFIIVGAIVGGILRIAFGATTVEKKLSFDNDLFLQILLPPIIFQAALTIDKRAFRRDLFPILAFASVGTAFSAIAIGAVAHYVSSFMAADAALPLMDSLVFGSLISSIDPVATLGILTQVGVSQTDTLYVLIFGESLLNDGVSIVLFDALKSHLGDANAQLDSSTYRQIASQFVIILLGSISIGLFCGVFCTIYFWALRGRQTAVTEVMIFFTWSLIPYYIADGMGCSGIIAIMVMGFFMDYFVIGGFQSEESDWMDYMTRRNEAENGLRNIHSSFDNSRWDEFVLAMRQSFSGRGHILSRSRHHVGFVAHVIAALMDTAIFAYLGLFLFNDNVWHFRLSMTAILGCVSSRVIMVLALSLLVNCFVYLDVEGTLGRFLHSIRRVSPALIDDDDIMERVYLDKKTQVILLLAGVRGAVSFALMESIPIYDAVTKTGSKFKPEIKAMTSSSIVFTLFVFGALTYFMVEFGGGGNGRGPSTSDNPVDNDRPAGNLTHRLLSEPLDSDDDDVDLRSETNSMEAEIRRAPMSFHASNGSSTSNERQQYSAPTNPQSFARPQQPQQFEEST